MDTEVSTEGSACTLHGSLLLPEEGAPVAVALIHPGSGPTDRDGNSRLGLQTDAYRQLAAALSRCKVATLRIDKRAIGKSVINDSDIAALTIYDYVADTLTWLRYLRQRLDCPVFIIGHSEGGLIALLAAQRLMGELGGLVLLSVSSRRFADLVLGQLEGKFTRQDIEASGEALAALAGGANVADVPEMLEPIFHPSVQAYIRSRLSIDPLAVAQDVDVPFAVVGGSADIQVEASDSKRFVDASAANRFIEIKGMTHTLKQVVSAASDQSAEYTDRTLPLSPELVQHITGFIFAQS